MAPFTKPETVLKQAEGLISVGQTHAALQSLTEMFSSKRFRNTALSSLEPIMLRFIQLCVDLRKGRTAKDGLMQYKNIAQNSSVQSIENVIKYFIQLADAKVTEAQEKANKAVALLTTDIDDLEASETPESILLGAVSGDQSKDRTDRALVTPWLKFLWEAYRTALETLKNNNRLETIYQQIAQQAFKFCLKHIRKVEFRRLCETLRLHLSNVAKYQGQAHSINLSDPDTLQHHLDTRFAQLNTSVELELWQEAFRSVEDIHNLLNLAKKAPRPAMMANYYEKLAKIFLTSGSALFHAAAWSRYFAVIRAMGGKTDEELSKLAGLVLVSALAVPVGIEQDENAPEETKGRNARLTSLLGLTKTPTRATLLKDALSRNTLKASPPAIQQLHQILEVTFHPLTICSTIAPVLQNLSSDPTYSPYLPLLHKVLLSRLFNQLSQVYSGVKISHVLELVAPLNAQSSTATTATIVYDHAHIEAFVMACAQRGELRLRVDHAQGSISFESDGFSTASFSSTSPTTLIRTRLTRLANALETSLSYLSPAEPQKAAEAQQAQFETLLKAVNDERSRLALHRTLVSRRSELLTELTVRKEKEEASRKAEQARKEKEEESRRQAELAKRRERERIERELENMRIDETKKLAQTLIEKGTLKVDVENIAALDSDKLLQLQVEQLDKEKRDLNERLRITAKRIDHLERAFRKDEKPLLAQDYANQQTTDKVTYEQNRETLLKQSKQQHTEDLANKKRLGRMMGDYQAKRLEIAGRQEDELRKRREKAKAEMEKEKAARRNAILKKREEENRRNEAEERQRREEEEERRRQEEELEAEEARRREEEEAARAAEEQKKQEEEEKAAAARKAREVERQKAIEEAKLKMQREEEAIARRAAGRTAPKENPDAWRRSTPATPRSESPAPRTPVAGGGAYRPPGARGTTTDSSLPPSTGGGYRPPQAREGEGSGLRRTVLPGAPAGESWRDREKRREEAAAANGPTNGRSSPKPTPGPSSSSQTQKPAEDDDGFKPVPAKQVWKPRHAR